MKSRKSSVKPIGLKDITIVDDVKVVLDGWASDLGKSYVAIRK